MADASSVSVTLGAAAFGPGVVVTSAGVAFAQAAVAPAAASNAYWYYDGSNLVGNVPTGKGFSFNVAGSVGATFDGAVWSFSGNGTDPAGSTVGFGKRNGASDLIANVPLGRSLFLRANGTNIGLFEAIGATQGATVGQFAANHIAGGSAAMSVNRCLIGLGAGTTSSGTNVTASGHDIAGRVGVTVNSTGTVSKPILLIQWANAYASPPFVHLTPANSATGLIPVAQQPFVNTTTSGFTIEANTTGLAAGTYAWMFAAVQ